MFIGSSSLNPVNNLIFGAGYDHVERVQEEDDEPEDEPDHDAANAMASTRSKIEQGASWKRESMYVTLFEGE
jgi:hypothetical protein